MRVSAVSLALCATLAASACSGGDALDTSLLTDRLWLERKPRDDRDLVRHMFFINEDGQRFGADGKASNWRVELDIFGWKPDGKQLHMFYPQDRTKRLVEVDLRKCNEVPGFDLCLTLTSKNGARRYYSNREQRIPESLAAEAARRASSADLEAP